MHTATFEERSVAAVGCNRFRTFAGELKLVARYREGRHVEDWQEYRVAQVADEVYALATAWRMLGLQPQQTVAIMSPNRPRWVTSFCSLFMTNAVAVPVYPTLTAGEAAFIMRDAGARFAVVDSLEQAEKVLSKAGELPALEKVFVMDGDTPHADGMCAPYTELLCMADGKFDESDLMRDIPGISGEDVAAIIYTSGTTGRPKGALLTNANFLSQRAALDFFDLSQDDIFLNHLPFSHSFGLTADLLASINAGARLVIADGIAPEQVRFALTTIRPTVLMSVPRLFEKIYMQVQQVVATKPRRIQALFNGALDVGKQVFDLRNEGRAVPMGLALRSVFARRIAGKVLRQAGMERVRVAYAGGAPLSLELCYFFQSLGIDIFQGYGLTETSPISNVNRPGKNKLGTVGPPIPGVEERIADDGEVLIRGANIMRGYHNAPEETAEAIDGDGWFHTGDIGEIDEDGYLTIIDRKKELIITSGGKNIAPLAIESAFTTNLYVQRLVVIGESRKHLVGLVCPDFEALWPWARENGIACATDAELAAHPKVVALLEQCVAEVNANLPRFAQIKKIAVMDHEFSEATGEITPTEKIKRRVIDVLYKDAIEKLYADSSSP